MTELIIPSKIPWDQIQGKDLEELLYWLLDEMGAKDLEWRIGGTGGGAADQGRDLEAFFYMQSPDGEIIRQKWWIECKGRSKTVEAQAVKEAVITAAGINEIDVILIATNAQFSNPTRDWIKQWLDTKPRPVVRLWDRNDLEKLVCKHPSVISRLYGDCLSLQGKLEVIRSQFWNHAYYPGTSVLVQLWKGRAELQWNNMSLIAVIAGEAANGNVARRPWPLILSNKDLCDLLALSIVNAMPFAYRASRAGITSEHYVKAVAYTVLVAIDRLGARIVSTIINNCWADDYPKEIRRFTVTPILRRLHEELFDICTTNCRRVMTDPCTLDKEAIEDYWHRLRLIEPQDETDKETKESLIIEALNSPCKIGFDLDKKRHCPIWKLAQDEFDNTDEEPEINVDKVIEVFEKIVVAHKKASEDNREDVI
jgi:hypothetical protein